MRPLVWLSGEIKTPPFTREGRIEAGTLLLLLQRGQTLSLPQSRPMPSIGPGCHELRIRDEKHQWRIFYRIEPDCILILGVEQKKTAKTPPQTISNCQRRLKLYLRNS